MKKYLNRMAKWLAGATIAIALIIGVAYPANADIIAPGETFVGPLVPQFAISAVDCRFPDVGAYSFTVSDRPMPLTTPNYVPCDLPFAIDSIYPPGDVGGSFVEIENIGDVLLNVEPIFR